MEANIPKIFEGAIASSIYATMGDSGLPRIRTWQAIDSDKRWSPVLDRQFPVIDITASAPATDPTDKTLTVTITITIATNAEDDPTHEQISSLYAGVQGVLDRMYADNWGDPTGEQLIAFMGFIDAAMDGERYAVSIGGFEFGGADEPSVDGGTNSIAMQFIIHYSRNDYV